MHVLIVYGTKTGTTETCAERIRDALGSSTVDLVDVRKSRKLDPRAYDAVVIGTPLYMGGLNRGIRRFLQKHEAELLETDLHFFLCGFAQGQESVDLFEKKVSPALFQHARQIRHVGGEVHPERLNPLFRSITEKVIKEENPPLGIQNETLSTFATTVQQGA